MYRIEMLGGLRVTRGEYVYPRFSSQKSAALLAYLAYFPNRTHSREHLVEMLWPNVELTAGRNRLKQELTRLRQVLTPPDEAEQKLLLSDRNSVWLDTSLLTTDVAEFETLLQGMPSVSDVHAQVKQIEAALQCYRGRLLPTFYEDWVSTEQEQIALRYLHALRQGVSARERTGDLEGAIEWARMAIRTDHLGEEAYCDLMRLLLTQERPVEALRVYNDLQTMLQTEFNVSPSTTAQQLAHSCQQRPSVSTNFGEASAASLSHAAPAPALFPAVQPSPVPSQTSPHLFPAGTSSLHMMPSRSTHGDRPGMTPPLRLGLAVMLAAGLVFTLRRPQFNTPAIQKTQYQIEEIGALPGDRDSHATAVNDKGEVTGYSNNGISQHAFLWRFNAGLRGLTSEKGKESCGYAINGNSEMVGQRVLEHGAFFCKAGQAMQFIPPLPGEKNVCAFGINGQGQVVGVSIAGRVHAFIWDSTQGTRQLTPPPELTEASCTANKINDAGLVAGGLDAPSCKQACVWDSTDHIRLLGLLPGGTFSSAVNVNADGEVVGQADDEKGNKHPCLFPVQGGIEVLATPNGKEGMAHALNSHNQVVGQYTGEGGRNRAFLWDKNHGSQDLTGLLPSASDWTLTIACSINARGQIVGEGLHHGQLRGFILTPLPDRS